MTDQLYVRVEPLSLSHLDRPPSPSPPLLSCPRPRRRAFAPLVKRRPNTDPSRGRADRPASFLPGTYSFLSVDRSPPPGPPVPITARVHSTPSPGIYSFLSVDRSPLQSIGRGGTCQAAGRGGHAA
eukprot:4952735-Pyramimonas_sp.AAC.1